MYRRYIHDFWKKHREEFSYERLMVLPNNEISYEPRNPLPKRLIVIGPKGDNYLIYNAETSEIEFFIFGEEPAQSVKEAILQKFSAKLRESENVTNKEDLVYILETRLVSVPEDYSSFQHNIRKYRQDYEARKASFHKYVTQAESPLKYPYNPIITAENSVKKGVAFCHGHNHKPLQVPKGLENVKWTLVDVNPSSNPDIVGGFGSMETLQQLGLYSWDYVLEQYCPIRSDFNTIFRGARYLLKTPGRFILNNFQKELLKHANNLMKDHYYTNVQTKGRFTIFST